MKEKKMAQGGIATPDMQAQLAEYLKKAYANPEAPQQPQNMDTGGVVGDVEDELSAIPGYLKNAFQSSGIAQDPGVLSAVDPMLSAVASEGQKNLGRQPTPPPPPDTDSEDQKYTPENGIPSEEGQSQKAEQDVKTVDSHPGHTAEDLNQYIQGQEQNVDKWGPDKEAAVMQSLFKSQNGLGMGLARTGTTLGDALMQVSGHGAGEATKNLAEQQNQLTNTVGNLLPGLNTRNLEALKTKQGLEAQTSQSPLGAADALAYKLLAQQVFPGLTDEQYAQMASNPESLQKMLPTGVSLDDAIARIKETAAYQQGMLQNTALSREQQGEEFRTANPLKSLISGFGQQGAAPAQGQFDHSSIPVGQIYQAPDGTMRKKT